MFARVCFTGVLLFQLLPAAEYPEARLATSKIEANIYLPDAKGGFYRGLRFDWSGVIANLKVDGHDFYTPWFDKYDASVVDFVFRDRDIVAGTASAATGPVQEFKTPLGYDTAMPGGTFVKVGVGVLRKGDNADYNSYKAYDVVDPGKWSFKQTKDSIEFTQVLNSAASNYKYIYTKTIRLVHDKPQMTMEHTLRNTGSAAIHTDVYNHNFLRVDNGTVGPHLTATFPFEIKPASAPDPQFAKLDTHRFVYAKNLEGKDQVSTGIEGFGSNPSDYDIRTEDRKAGVGVRIRADRPLMHINLWSIRSVMAVEPFIEITAEPGKEFHWKYTYDYYSVEREHF
jgi:hypothetical protein